MVKKIWLFLVDYFKSAGWWGVMFYATLFYVPLAVSSPSFVLAIVLMALYLSIFYFCLYKVFTDM